MSVFGEQLANWDFQGFGNGLKLQNGEIPNSAFDPRHVRPVEPRGVSQGLLGEATRSPGSPDSIPNLAEQGWRGFGHAPMLDR